ncbi:MAG TPA: type II secretion system F family protein [Syntrophales bacterium]|nr:type II secretion system F family protein [Syntrophales bacterium]HPI56395.1 type II secretion system F family protein [Syntrophales bacterium]HPN24218.1 type II secretion system F family protein [Syntrophales bacterium]HQM28571.1 type II secretion system F family protein [Syntrophales bacterium]
MPKFTYEAIAESGAALSGVIEAESAEMANTLLATRGYIPSKVKRVSEGGVGRGLAFDFIQSRLASVKASELILFTKQFRTMFRAGVPIMRIFEVLGYQTQNPKLKRIITGIAGDIQEGATLSDALSKHPDTFTPLYRSMIKAGETSGNIPEVLERMIYILEHEHKIKSDIRSAMQYPIIVLIALGVAFFVLLTFVIPRFVTIFSRAGLALPWPTKVSMVLYSVLSNYWYICLAAVVLGGIALRMYFKTPVGRYTRDAFILRIPLIGTLFIRAAMSRFASIFSILQSSGVPVMTSLQILSGTIGNTAIAREFDRVRDRVEEGRGISGPLNVAKYFTPMVIQMVSIGEESGQLDEMLKAVSTHYDDEVAYSVQRLSEAVGPILVVGLAAVVGFFAMAIFLPMWDLTQVARTGF